MAVDTSTTTAPSATPGDCCTSPTAGTPGATPMIDDTVIPVWTPTCDGGGSVSVASDVTNSEDWDPQ